MRFRQMLAFLFCFLFVGAAFTVPAQAEIEIGQVDDITLFTEIRAVGALQALDQSGGGLESKDPTFNTAYGDMAFRAQLDDYAELYFNTWQASRPHEDRWFGHEGYMRIDHFPEDYPISALNPMMRYVDVKVGEFEIDYGWYQDNTSLNANVQQNALVGNPVVKAQATEPGLEVIRDDGLVNWVVGFGNGGPTTNAKEGVDFSYHAKIWKEIVPGAELAASFWRQDNSSTTGTYGGPGNLFSSDRAGGRYGAVWGGGDSPGNILPGNGYDETAWQVDLRTNPTSNTNLNVLYGHIQDADVNGASGGSIAEPEQSWNNYAVEAKHSLTENIYVAGRYSGAEVDTWQNESGTNTNSGQVDRFQLGAGMWIYDGFLGKLEYVQQEASDFKSDAPLGSSLNATGDPEFDGLIAEFSMQY